ncbi:hypothetical protein HDU76_008777 [Blyttiomyces sp. JEL0837]|nr:hypothetical protein HDU76_008777 [Blyttiomyces sp. JEL0837]
MFCATCGYPLTPTVVVTSLGADEANTVYACICGTDAEASIRSMAQDNDSIVDALQWIVILGDATPIPTASTQLRDRASLEHAVATSGIVQQLTDAEDAESEDEISMDRQISESIYRYIQSMPDVVTTQYVETVMPFASLGPASRYAMVSRIRSRIATAGGGYYSVTAKASSPARDVSYGFSRKQSVEIALDNSAMHGIGSQALRLGNGYRQTVTQKVVRINGVPIAVRRYSPSDTYSAEVELANAGDGELFPIDVVSLVHEHLPIMGGLKRYISYRALSDMQLNVIPTVDTSFAPQVSCRLSSFGRA